MRTIMIFFVLCSVVFSANSQATKKQVVGKVTSEGKSIDAVSVSVKNTSTGVLTNKRGEFGTEAAIGDVLVFNYLGLQTVEVVIDKKHNIYNIEMSSEMQELDEVVVKEKRAFTQKELLAQYPTNKNLIKTSRGILDKERASFSMQVIDAENLINVGADFLNSLQNLYPKMIVNRDCPGKPICPRVFLQSWSFGASPTAIFDVDGFIHEKPPTFLTAEDIERVVIMLRNGAISRYGPAGAGGVIVINTKAQNRMDEMGVDRTYNNADLIDSLQKKIAEKKPFIEMVITYLQEYEVVQSEKQALELFDRQKEKYQDFPYYFLDVSTYFRTKWGNEKKAQEIYEDFEERFSNDPVALKALAYNYETLGSKDKALVVYLRILKIKSKDAQSHRDVANAYSEIGNYKKALSNYARYELAVKELDTLPFDTYGDDLLMTTEIRNIIRVKGNELALDKNILKKDETWTQNVRLLFEWNNPKADFKLQVVSPDDYYDDWRTLPAESNKRIKGYLSKQFFLDDDFDGEWQVNINCAGNNSDVPTYLKVTVFFDYGKSSQSKQFTVFKLQEKDIDFKLISIFTKEKSITP